MGNLALQILFMYLNHKVALVGSMVPNIMKLNETNEPLKSVVSVTKHLKAEVAANLMEQLKKQPTVISPEYMGTLKRRHIRHSMPATSSRSLSTKKRFHTEDDKD